MQSRPVGSSVCLDAGAQGWNIEDLIGSGPVRVLGLFWFGTLLGPEGTAVSVVFFSTGSPPSSIPRRAATAGGSAAGEMSRWVFEI